MSIEITFKLLVGATLSLAAGLALATPTYTGPTTGSFSAPCTGSGPNSCPSSTPTTGGYWIWTTGGGDWSIRWTGGQNALASFKGIFTVQAGTLNSVGKIAFESGQDQLFVTGDGFFEEGRLWDARANAGWNGIDFSLTADATQIEFDLFSSIWNGDFSDISNGSETAGQDIFIGDLLKTPRVEITRPRGMEFRSFEIAIPEPGTLALLGLGLIGMGFSRRKATK